MNATDEERQAVWESLLLRSNRGVLMRGDIIETAAYFHLSRFSVARIWGEDQLDGQTRPLLTPAHKVARLRFCMKHVQLGANGDYFFDPMYDVVHMDEKWFYVKRIDQKVYLLTGKDGKAAEEPTVQYVHRLWPVVERYTTQRASVNRPAGVEEHRPVSITRKISRRMLIDNLIPAIKARWSQNQKHMHIRLQQDNARPHVDEDDPLVLSAGCSDGWTITLSNQPAQSPDLNSLALGFFSSIQSLQCRTVPRTTEELIAEVRRPFNSTTADTLNKTFLTLQLVMRQIMSCGGCNDFRLGHMHKDRLLAAGTLHDAIPCDVQTVIDAHLGIDMLSALSLKVW
ncbi:unnamed protein product [Phytophthora fragariaefolia]|uniref:Unnamed protein product n=1 Tax=Phytophthora fragariaefolia TaxID=1490495 RepID=A0A9W6XLP5_9STRA|nr:unnamed protein product [Phytophthora fragariaefolia]